MKLFYSPTSPYARIVRIALIEKRLDRAVEFVPVNPLEDETGSLESVNPLAKVPTLVTDSGEALYDSRIICDYLDIVAPDPRLIPEDETRIHAMRDVALGIGIMDAALAIVMERRRPAEHQSHFWINRWTLAAERGCRVLLSVSDQLPMSKLAMITTYCAFDYLRFRLAGDIEIDGEFPARFFALGATPAVRSTDPRGAH
ncbi:MAG: glutathione S-transferase N-terminal domain-containing protein [Sphingomonadaceae bacterium]